LPQHDREERGRRVASPLRVGKDFVDYYVIVDTGSTDDTIPLIRREMSGYGIEGEIHERPWVDFGVNRQQALELAVQADKGQWLLIIDADEELGVADPHFFEKLEPGVSYDLEKHHSGVRYAVPHLIDVRQTQWKWEAPVHNYLVNLSGSKRRQLRKDVWIKYHPGQGAKSHGLSPQQKYLRDAELLERYLLEKPDDPRSLFYLAQSYKHAGDLEAAYATYQRRTGVEGWAEERFMAQLECGRVAMQLGKPEADVVSHLLAAYDLRPTRAEPVYELAHYFRTRKAYGKAFLFATAGVQIPWPKDSLFVAQEVYEWRLLDELSVAAFWVKDYAACSAACQLILQRHDGGAAIAEPDLVRIRENLERARAQLGNPKPR
jgi:hypothetical protein